MQPAAGAHQACALGCAELSESPRRAHAYGKVSSCLGPGLTSLPFYPSTHHRHHYHSTPHQPTLCPPNIPNFPPLTPQTLMAPQV